MYPYGCVRYIPTIGTVKQLVVVRCLDKTECYDVQIKWDVCTEKLYNIYDTEQGIADKYPVGGQKTVFVPKHSSVACTSNTWEIGVSLPVSGVFFISVGGTSVLVFIVWSLWGGAHCGCTTN